MGTENGSAAGLGTGVSLQPFYSSGPDGEFVLVNGGFQPVVTLQVRSALLLMPSRCCRGRQHLLPPTQ